MNMPKAYAGKEPYIFVSYAHRDSEDVLPIISALQDRGFRVWYDAGIEAGTEWPEYIAEHLDGCSAALVFISEHSLKSHNCRREINFAIDLKKDMLVVHLQDVEMSLGMRMQLGTLQAMFRNRHSSMDSFLEELGKCQILQMCRGDHVPVKTETENKPAQNIVVTPQYSRYAQQRYEDGKAQLQKGNLEEAVEYFRKAASECHVEAQYELGCAYLNGRGVKQSDEEAWTWFEMAAMQGHSESEFMLGNISEVYEDTIDALKWYQKAAQKDHVESLMRLGTLYRLGEVVDKDPQAAAAYFRRGAEQGNVWGQYELGELYFSGDGVAQDYQEAVKWFQSAARMGNDRAQYRMGECFEHGYGVIQDPSQALKWYQMAAVQNHPDACYRIARCYEFGIGVEKDEKEAGKWFNKAVEAGLAESQLSWDESALSSSQTGKWHYDMGKFLNGKKEYANAVLEFYIAAKKGDVQAQYELAVSYQFGFGVEADNIEAVKWYRTAAERGHANAQFCLGGFYASGKGVEKDAAEAAKWNTMAAEQGHADAQYWLGYAYQRGNGVVKNEAEAVKWYKKAAEQGSSDALLALGRCYEEGIGVKKNILLAKIYFHKADKR